MTEPRAEQVRAVQERHPVKRGWCPDLLHPMPTGDGLLIRLHTALGRLTVAQVKVIAAAAESCGNRLIDVSSRGNLQIRGVSEHSYPALVDALAVAGLADPIPRRAIVSPFAGLDPVEKVDAAALALRIEAALQTVDGLPGKLAVVVDGGGMFPLFELDSEIYLVAVSPHTIAIGLATAEGPRWCGTANPAELPSALTALLTSFSEAVRGGKLSKMRDASSALRAKFADAARLGPPVGPSARPPGPRAGIVRLHDGGAGIVLALLFGRCDADQLMRVADWTERFADGEVRLSPWRGIVIPQVRQQYLATLVELACGAGFITGPSDPRLAVFACPGQPECTSASVMTRRDAARLAAAARPLLQSGGQIHVSGCAKGCAHSGPAALTLVGDSGAYRAVVEGTPRDPGLYRLAIDDIEQRLSLVETRADLASRFWVAEA